jgi:hypothetical protein
MLVVTGASTSDFEQLDTDWEQVTLPPMAQLPMQIELETTAPTPPAACTLEI